MHDVELFLHAGFQARLKTDFQKAYIQQKQKKTTTWTKVVLKASKISQGRKVADSVFSQVAYQLTTILLETNLVTNHRETLEVLKKKVFSRASFNGFL